MPLIALLLSILFSVCAHAQDDEPVTDTIVHIPLDDVIQQEEEGDVQKHFWNKSEYSEQADTLNLRGVPADQVKRMKSDKDFWYADLEAQKEKEKKEGKYRTPLFRREWFQALLWIIIIGGFAAFLMIYLSGNRVGMFRKRKGSFAGDEAMGETEDIFAINYQKEIDKAVEEKNYRLATRLMFLRILKKLSDKHVIRYKQELTNLDYLMQLQPTTYYTAFFRITRNYEYSWYGWFDINEDIFGRIRNDFSQFENQIDRS